MASRGLSIFSVLAAFTTVAQLAACVESSAVPCSDGRICPSGTVCVDNVANVTCAQPEQLTVCQTAAAAVGDVCSMGICVGADAIAGELCVDCVCAPARCGDGLVTVPEQCDGQALGVAPLCTDHGFYEATNVACGATCEYDAAAACSRSCGDGVVEVALGEQCDDDIAPVETCTDFGFDAGFAGCRAGGCSADLATCRYTGWQPVVGDAVTHLAMSSIGTHVFVASVDTLKVPIELVVWHFDGISWTRLSTGVSTYAKAIYAASPTDVYVIGTASGSGQVAHFNGSTWTVETVAQTSIGRITGSSASDIWMFGDAGVTRHFNGTTWTPGTIANLSGTVRSAVALGPMDVWVTTDGTKNTNRVFHYVSNWQTVTDEPITFDAFAAVAGKLYGVGVNGGTGGVFRRDALGWTELGDLDQPALIYGNAADDLYALGFVGAQTFVYHYDGTLWTFVRRVLGPIAALGGTGPDNVFAVEGAGKIAHYSGNAWDTSRVGITDISATQLTSVATVNGELFVVQDNQAVHRFVAEVDSETSFPGARGLGRVGAALYLAADTGIFRWDGVSWQPESTPGGTQPDEVAGTATAAFAIGYTNIATRGSGATWTNDTSNPNPLHGLWCGTVLCVIVGEEVIRTWNGTTWSVQTVPTILRDVWGSSDTNIYAVGDAGTVYHYDGTAWTPSRIFGEASRLVSISGTAANDIVTTTDFGQLYHLDGAHWAPIRDGRGGIGTIADVLVTPNVIWSVGSDANFSGHIFALRRTYVW